MECTGTADLMTKMLVPAELLLSLAEITSGNPTAETLAKMNTQITELVTLKMRLKQGDPSLTIRKKRIHQLHLIIWMHGMVILLSVKFCMALWHN